jgi:hypothetical protein
LYVSPVIVVIIQKDSAFLNNWGNRKSIGMWWKLTVGFSGSMLDQEHFLLPSNHDFIHPSIFGSQGSFQDSRASPAKPEGLLWHLSDSFHQVKKR